MKALAGDVMAGGGGALRGLRRTSNISRQVASACRCIYINFPLVTYRVSGVCTLAVQRWSKRESCRRSRVLTWFAPFLNPDFYWYIPAQTSTYRHNTVYTGTTQYIPVCTVRMCLHLLYGMCWYMLVYTSIYWYILVYTSMYRAFRHKDFFEISKWIQHCTRQDNKVPESPDGMCWYMLV